MTASGFKGLEEELNRLKNEDRHEIIKAIAEARAHGDLSENAEYHAAKEKQSFIEGRVMELEDQIGRAEVIDISKLSGTSIKFGATVTLVDEDTDEKRKYQIVGDVESDAKKRPHLAVLPHCPRPDRQEQRRHGRSRGARRRAVVRDPQGRVRLSARPASSDASDDAGNEALRARAIGFVFRDRPPPAPAPRKCCASPAARSPPRPAAPPKAAGTAWRCRRW